MSVTTLMVWVVLITAIIGGCAHYPVNPKLKKFDLAQVSEELAFNAPNRSDELFLVLAFSGGGTRAAALAYGVLEGLAQIEVSPPSHPSSSENQVKKESHRLTHEVDAVTGVSGGSITAAYFALHGDGIFKGFKEEFLYRNVTWGLIGRLLNPYNMIRVGSAYFSKSDLQAEYLDDHLFHGATYNDLEPGKAPYLLIQATDISDGNYFLFIPLQFGLICSDLSAFPLARATAASSSVPGPFGAITLRNYAGQCGFREEAWLTNALAKRDYSSRSYRLATQFQAYTEWNDKPFIHLVDGVVSDNLGLRGILDFLVATGDASAALRARGLDKVKRVAFIIVNAETKHSTRRWSLLEEDPGLTDIGDVALTAMINNYTFESVALLRQLVKEWSSLRQEEHPDRQPLDYYVIEVTFDAMADVKERQVFLDLPTSFNLSDEQVDRLRYVGQRILFDSPDFQRLVRDLGGKGD
jgi:NTE family protein